MNNLNVFRKVRIGLILLVMFLISSTAWAVPTPSPVKYLDENGETKTITDYIELVGDESPDDPMFKNGGWFVVKGEVTYDEAQGHYLPFELQIDKDWNRLGPDVNLILADGAKLTAKNEDIRMSFRNLAVYAQSTGENMGKFEVYAKKSTAIDVFNAFTVYGGSVKAHSFEEYEYGIWAGSVTVNGGIVDAAGITYGIYAGDRKVIVNGGSVTAAGFSGIFGYEGIEINGGDVDATATGVSDENNFSYAIGSWYDVNVNGGSLTVHAKDKSSYGVFVSGSVAHLNAGEVIADGEGSGIAARPSCSSSGVELAGATVTTNRYTYIDDLRSKSGFFVKVANDVLYTDGEGNVFEGSIFKWDDLVGEFIDKLDVVAGKTLTPVYKISFETGDENISIESQKLAAGTTPTKPVDPERKGYKFAGWYADKDFKTEFDWNEKISQDITVYAKWKKELPPVEYLDENGETKTITDYIELTGDESPDDPMFKNGGWFVVKGEVTYDEAQGNYLPFELQIDKNWNRLGPDVNLILADGAKLTAKNEDYYMSFRNLAVYAQSTGENMGKFEVYAKNSTAIDVFNAFTVYGGSVKAHSFGEYEYGIWAREIVINGGIVDAAGITYGIYASDEKVIINGGSVTAAGFIGILGSEGIEINGGDVDATATGVSDEYNFSYAIGSWYDVNVNGGSLTVHAKDKSSYGVYVSGSVAHLNAGEVFADGEGSGFAARPSCSSSGVELAGATVTTNRYTYIDDLGPKSDFFVKVAVNVLYTDGEGNVFEGSIFKWDDLVGEFIDKLDVVAGKTLRPVKPNIVVTQDGEGKIHAEINGNYIGEDDFIITDRIEVDEVKFERDFTTEGYSTIVLPFNIKTSLLVGVDSVLSFNGIVLDENKKKAVAMQVVWEKSMEEVELRAYTPYMIKMSDKSLEILGSVVLETTRDAVTEKDGWEFRGTYSFMKWTEDSPDLGRVYGFAASSEGDVSVGQFVKIAAGASIRPLRAYLIHNVPSTVRANGYYANRNVASIKDELPEQMNVVIVGKDKNGEEHTTVIGQFNTRSGEFRANSVKRVYDLKGRPVNKDARKVRGAYYGKNLLH